MKLISRLFYIIVVTALSVVNSIFTAASRTAMNYKYSRAYLLYIATAALTDFFAAGT